MLSNFRPRLLDFVSSLDEASVESASRRAFAALPDLSKAVSELTVLNGVGPATASAVLAAYAPDVAPFMSDEVGLRIGWKKDYSFALTLLYLQDLSADGNIFTPADVERALWSSAVGSKLLKSPPEDGLEAGARKSIKRKRKF
ncbi:hypothetical protein BHE74_00012094 [Ensete ventricosum]|uniref:HhH-GPD domain-containing protein n=1 Tax=Ensete ventricosum TaxID=4639 RepID=A0A444CEH6_ENSVE|nr:hypothetical protein B296_00059205 [Ensete ventricosum]RWV84274.1 hypothetical protein GW17_00054020 [Ensete ventricosum]RWW79605.1 hypothetical protein BHE74_00012094 [Ensete ventricosum]RZR74012.1 hypothetical protein BHM03_00031097 [Ensete ventricosum]